MFTPTIVPEVLSNSTVLRIIDNTGPDIGAGTKWDGISGINSSTVSSAMITVTDPNGDVITIDVTSNILSSSPVTGNITFDDQVGEWIDGYYNFIYYVWMTPVSITKFEDHSSTVPLTTLITAVGHQLTTGMRVSITGTTNYNGNYDVVRVNSDTFYIKVSFVTDEATGVSTPLYESRFVAFFPYNAINAVTRMYQVFSMMEDGNEADDYLKQCNTVWGLLQAVTNASEISNPTIVNNIYGRAMRILDYNSIELQFT